jgi:ethanolamine utilization protein EutN
VYLARVIGRVVATRQYEGLAGVPLQWIQPLDEDGAAMGDALVACAVVSTGPGDLVQFVDGREAALACPETFVPVDAAIIGFVEEAVSSGRLIGREDTPRVRPVAPVASASSKSGASSTERR